MTDESGTPERGDKYTAASEAIPSERGAATSRTLGECFRAWLLRASPRIIASVAAVAIIVRVVLGAATWRDPVVIVAMLAVVPFFEWFVHLVVLHAKPRTIFGVTIEAPNARDHRRHHEIPADLDHTLLSLRMLPANLLALVVVGAAFGWGAATLLGGDVLRLASTGVAFAWTYLLLYEWTHFLMHSPYRAKTRYYRHIWKNHRLHHYKNEHYWFGITNTTADQLLHTAPDQNTVERSPTARNLHGGVGT